MGNKLSRINEFINRHTRLNPETGHDPAIHGSRLEDRFYNNSAFKVVHEHDAASKAGMTEDEAAIKIQAGYRGYVGRMQVRQKRSEVQAPYPNKLNVEQEDGGTVAAEKDQSRVGNGAGELFKFEMFELYCSSQQTHDAAPTRFPVEGQESSPLPQEGLDVDLEDPEVAKAALKIQSGFRGHMARQEIKRKKEEEEVTVSQTPAPEEAQQEAEEEVDIDLTDPEVEKAAIKIQAGFKGYKVRKLKTAESAKPVEEQGEEVTEDEGKSQAETQDEGMTDAERQQAATKIQASYRGYQTRKTLKGAHQLTDDTDALEEEAATFKPEDQEVVDIDLDDPEVEKAAVKIQASFKGFKARKELKDSARSQPDTLEVPTEDQGEGQQEEAQVDLPDPAREHAAIKIQAGYRGYRTRQEVRSRRAAVQQQAEQTEDATADGDDAGDVGDDQEAVEEAVANDAAEQQAVDEYDHGEQAIEDAGGEAELGNEGDGADDEVEQPPNDADEPAVQDPGLGEEATAKDEEEA